MPACSRQALKVQYALPQRYGNRDFALLVTLSPFHVSMHCHEPHHLHDLLQLAEQGPVRDYEMLFSQKDGVSFWGAVAAACYVTDSGDKYLFCSINDITKQKEMGAEAVAVSLFNGEQRDPRVFVMRLPNGTIIEEQAFELAESLLHWLTKRKELVIIYDLAEDPRVQMHQEYIRTNRLVSYLGVPMVSRHKVIGVLHILTTKPMVFGQQDLSFFITLAGQAAIAVDNVRLVETLKAVENKYRSLVENTPDVIFSFAFEPSPHLEYISPTVKDITGHNPKEFYSNPDLFVALVHPDDRLLVEEALKGCLPPRKSVNLRLRKKDGGYCWVATRTKATFDKTGRIVRIEGILRDNTERRIAQKQLEESEAQLRAITDTAQDAVIMLDPQGKVSYWNPAAQRILGYTRDEALGQAVHTFLAPERYHEAYSRAYTEFQRSGRKPVIGKTLELEALSKDGNEIPVELSVSAKWDDSPEGHGPTGRPIRTNSPQILKDISTEHGPWIELARSQGFVTSGSFPLTSRGQTFGALNLYSRDLGFFHLS